MKITLLTAILLATNLLPAIAIAPGSIDSRSVRVGEAFASAKASALAERLRQRSLPSHRLADAAIDNNSIAPQQVRTHATQITVRISAEKNGGSGVLIAKKAAKGAPGSTTYLILTNKHVIGNSSKFQIQTADGKRHTAQLTPNTQINPKYDVALLQFTSTQKYQLADLRYDTGSAMTTSRKIYSAGFPFDSQKLRFTSGEISQLSDVPLEDGTQIGYITDKGAKNIRQGMSGGPVLAISGDKAVVVGINTIGAAPLVPSYTYFDGSKPNPKKAAEYTKSNWGVPIYNLLSQLNPDILYQYDNLPKVQRQVTPTGYMAQLNRQTRQQTVRIETNDGNGNGSGFIVAKQGNTYYVLTAKHVVTDRDNPTKLVTGIKTIAYDQESYPIQPTDITLAEGLDLAVVKFTSKIDYPVATLGNYRPLKKTIVFASGFPVRERIDSPLWQWQLNPGQTIVNQELGRFWTQDKVSFSDGYDLIYNSISYRGMSGGPVFDAEGRVVGIHGKVEGDIERQEWNEDLSLGNSLGISIQNFVRLAPKLKVNPQLLKTSTDRARDLTAGELTTMNAVRESISRPTAAATGKQWLQYGNQLHRLSKYAEAIAAFDRAIEIGTGYQWAGYYGRARALAVEKKFPQALAAIERAIVMLPATNRKQHYYLWTRQSGYFKELRDYPKALAAIDIAIGLEPTDRQAQNSKGAILRDLKQYARSIAIYDRLISSQPEYYLYFQRAYSKLAAGDKSEALLDCNKGISLEPLAAISYYGRGTFKYITGDKIGAIADFDRSISLDPNEDRAYAGRGLVKVQLQKGLSAIVDFDKAIALNADNDIAYHGRHLAKTLLGDKRGGLVDLDKAISLDSLEDSYYNSRAVTKNSLEDPQGGLLDANKAISIDPTKAGNYTTRANSKSQLGDVRGALTDSDRAIALDPKFALGYLSRAQAKLSLGDKQGALLDSDRSISLAPEEAGGYVIRSIIKRQLGDRSGALVDIDRAISIQPNKPDNYNTRADLKFQLGDVRGAFTDFDRAIALDPKSASNYSSRAEAKLSLGDKQGALLDSDRAISLAPKQASGYLTRATIKFQLGDRPGALLDIDRAISLAPKEALGYLNRSTIKFQLGDRQGALVDLDRAIAIEPGNASLYNTRGALKVVLEDRKAALLDFNKAIELNPKLASAYRNRGDVKNQLGDKQGAVDDYTQAIKIDPKFASAYHVRGALKSELGDKQGAFDDCTQAIKIDPKFTVAYNSRSVLAFELGNNTGSMTDLDRAIELNPKFASAYSNRGFMKIILGRDRDALADLEKSIALDPKLSEQYASRGFVREISGDRQRAIADYKQAIKLNPKIVSDWKKQAALIQTYNSIFYQKYQQMIQKLEAGSKS